MRPPVPENDSAKPNEQPALFEKSLLEAVTALSLMVTEERQKAGDTHDRWHEIEKATFELKRLVRELGR